MPLMPIQHLDQVVRNISHLKQNDSAETAAEKSVLGSEVGWLSGIRPAFSQLIALPLEKLLGSGAGALSDRELLAVLLGKGTRDIDVIPEKCLPML